MKEQPEALRLADKLEDDQQGIDLGAEGMGWGPSATARTQAAAELRRLHQSEREGWRYADELEQERQRLHGVNAEMFAELKYIAYANPKTWYEEMRDQFQQWAQSRARAAIAKAEGKP